LKSPSVHAMVSSRIAAIAVAVSLSACSSVPVPVSGESARDQVWAAELAFARTLADRNLNGFGDFIAEDAIFFEGARVLRGKSEVVAGWSGFFAGPDAPFSWEPDQVEVLGSGDLALSTGPVRDPKGNIVARFNSIWRLEPSGQWRVVFDKGSPPSPGPK
jgi:ketosteroid isomerase-like protein